MLSEFAGDIYSHPLEVGGARAGAGGMIKYTDTIYNHK